MRHLSILLAFMFTAQSALAFSVQNTSNNHYLMRKTIPVRSHFHKQSSSSSSSSYRKSVPQSSSALSLLPIDECSSMLISATEGWRQYVPLVVSVGVILDILLGSPIANLALGPMRRAAQEAEDGGDNNGMMSGSSGKKGFIRNPKERVDSDSVAQAALDKARNSMELRRFLEENKTDIQRAADARDMFDKEAQKFDERMANKKE